MDPAYRPDTNVIAPTTTSYMHVMLQYLLLTVVLLAETVLVLVTRIILLVTAGSINLQKDIKLL